MKIHFIGIKGIGMSALAAYLKNKGEEITGSDTKEKFYSEKILKKYKIKYFEGFNKKNIPSKTNLVISSAAYYDPKNIKPSNPEVLEVLRQKIPIKTYPQMISKISSSHYTICISGSHGKSTTTGMTGFILEKASIDPLVIVGGKLKNWGTNIRIPLQNKPASKQIFVLESDEYREAFLKYKPQIAVIMNISFDHPDYFSTPARYELAFQKFAKKITKTGIIIGWGDNPKVRQIISQSPARKKIFFGFKKENNLQVIDKGIRDGKQYFNLIWQKKNLGEFSLNFPGYPYLLDAAAASAVALLFNISPKIINKSLKFYKGISRRFEIIFRGDKNNPIIIDDHALSPEQIKATLEAAFSFWPKKKIIAVFQPHTFTRTKALIKDFAKIFTKAWETIILEIYGSAREKSGDISAKDLVYLTKKFHPRVKYLTDIPSAINYLKTKKNCVIITLGCENVWRISWGLKRLINKNDTN